MESNDKVSDFCGILLNLIHTNVTRVTEEEIEVLHAIGISCEMEKAVDLIVQAAIKDLPFPEENYAVLHNQSGGVDLIIGNKCGKTD